MGATSLSKRQDIPSRPLALFNASELISFRTISLVVAFKAKVPDTGWIVTEGSIGWNRRGCSSEILNLTPKGDQTENL